MGKIAFKPKKIDAKKVSYQTGNHHLFLYDINASAEILAFNIVHSGLDSLVNYVGEPIVKPFAVVDEQVAYFKRMDITYENSYIPTFKTECNDVDIQIRVIAPEEVKGFIYEMKYKNNSSRVKSVKTGISGVCSHLSKTITQTYKLKSKKNIFEHSQTGAAVCELRSPDVSLSLALLEETSEIVTNPDGYMATSELFMVPKEEQTLYFCFGVSTNADGAAFRAYELITGAPKNSIERYEEILLGRKVSIADPDIEEKTNYNLNYCYYNTSAFTLDNCEQVILASRNPNFEMPAVFKGADAGRYAFPSILRIDKAFAKIFLRTMFAKYLRNGICFAQYLDGSSMMVGQKLDNIISFLYALACYLNETGDTSVLNDSVISEGLSYIFYIIDSKYDAKTGLYFTQITPDNYYIKDNKNIVTFNNVFLWSVLKSIESFNIRGRVDTEKLFKNINDHCVIKSDYGLCYCYIMDNEGNKYLGDDNQGSLTLLPYLKFCSNEFAIYTTTMEYIYSENNPKYRSSGKLFGCACETVPKYPKLMGLCSYLMSNGFSFQYVNSIKNVNLPNMVACTTFDVANGEAKTGIYNASLAGYLAYTFILLYS